jgi:Actinobacteria/chloroflexi VLRF1 release factor
VARIREAAGGGRAVEVEPERLLGWFARFGERHAGLVAVDGTAYHVRFAAADGTSAEVAVPYGGLPDGTAALGPGAAASGVAGSGAVGARAAEPGADVVPAPPGVAAVLPDPVLAALHAHLVAPRRTAIVLVRLGGYSVGIAVDGLVEASTTGARPVHGRTRKGGSSSGRFARRRDNQARVALDAAADAVARFLLPAVPTLDAVVLGGDAVALDALRADRRLTALLSRAEPRVLDVPEPRRAVLDEAARRARAVEIVVREQE